MSSKRSGGSRLPFAALCAFLGTSLGACELASRRTEAPPSAVVDLPSYDTVSASACLKRRLQVLPDRDLTTEDLYRFAANAIDLDRAKTACGNQAVSWIRDVKAKYGTRRTGK